MWPIVTKSSLRVLNVSAPLAAAAGAIKFHSMNDQSREYPSRMFKVKTELAEKEHCFLSSQGPRKRGGEEGKCTKEERKEGGVEYGRVEKRDSKKPNLR